MIVGPANARGLPVDGRVFQIAERIGQASLSECELFELDGILRPCMNQILVRSSSSYNAWSRNGIIYLTTKIVDSSSDDEMAFIIAHELMHNILGHRGSGKQNEIDADSYATKLVLRAGYNAAHAEVVIRKINYGGIFNFPFSLITHPSKSKRIQAIRLAASEELGKDLVLRSSLVPGFAGSDIGSYPLNLPREELVGYELARLVDLAGTYPDT